MNLDWLPWRRWKRKWMRHGAQLAFMEADRIMNHAVALAAISGCSAEEASRAILSVLQHPAVIDQAISLEKGDFIHRILDLVRR